MSIFRSFGHEGRSHLAFAWISDGFRIVNRRHLDNVRRFEAEKLFSSARNNLLRFLLAARHRTEEQANLLLRFFHSFDVKLEAFVRKIQNFSPKKFLFFSIFG